MQKKIGASSTQFTQFTRRDDDASIPYNVWCRIRCQQAFEVRFQEILVSGNSSKFDFRKFLFVYWFIRFPGITLTTTSNPQFLTTTWLKFSTSSASKSARKTSKKISGPLNPSWGRRSQIISSGSKLGRIVSSTTLLAWHQRMTMFQSKELLRNGTRSSKRLRSRQSKYRKCLVQMLCGFTKKRTKQTLQPRS